jgi:hypothetical protein
MFKILKVLKILKIPFDSEFVERSRPNVNAKHLIGLFFTCSQSGFIYKLASESYYELLNFAVDGLILLLYVKIAICSRRLQFARAISRSILQYCVTILQCCPQRNTGFDCKRTYLNGFSSISCCLLFSFTFFISTQTWKIVVYKLASCAAILFIYVRSRSGRSTVFHMLPVRYIAFI